MLKKIRAFYNQNFQFILTLTVFLLIVIAWFNRFIQDDAFISFRYAENFVEGNGLVYNIGERVEGYTNFLWVLIISIPIYFKIDPILSSQIIGILFFSISLIFIYKFSKHFFSSNSYGVLAVIFIGTNYTFNAYATGGLETQMQTAFLLISIFLLLKINENQNHLLLSFLLGLFSNLLILTRPDSLLFAGLITIVYLKLILQKEVQKNDKVKSIILFSSSFLFILLPYLIWKINYYGSIIPNTYYVKSGSIKSLVAGVFYLYKFYLTYWLFPFLILLFLALKKIYNQKNIFLFLIISILIFWQLYLIKVGGGFMEFRFMVPVIPLLFFLFLWLIKNLVQQKIIVKVLIILIFLGSISHAIVYNSHSQVLVESKNNLQEHLYENDQAWIQIGKKLYSVFNGSRNIKIATTAAGAIPFYSELPTIDLQGLNDKWIAQNIPSTGFKTGHGKYIPVNYLFNRNVNLLIGHPLVREKSIPINQLLTDEIFKENFRILHKEEIPDDASLIEIPVNEEYNLYIIYLIKNKIIEKAINNYNLKVYKIPEEFRKN